MNKEQRERKRRLREDWEKSRHFHGETYPMWLERCFEHASTELSYMNRVLWHNSRRVEAFQQYIVDMETGLRVVERCARGTLGCETTIPSLKKEDATEAVVSAVVSLYHLLQDAKQRAMQISDAEKEAIQKHKEAINKRYEDEKARSKRR